MLKLGHRTWSHLNEHVKLQQGLKTAKSSILLVVLVHAHRCRQADGIKLFPANLHRLFLRCEHVAPVKLNSTHQNIVKYDHYLIYTFLESVFCCPRQLHCAAVASAAWPEGNTRQWLYQAEVLQHFSLGNSRLFTCIRQYLMCVFSSFHNQSKDIAKCYKTRCYSSSISGM